MRTRRSFRQRSGLGTAKVGSTDGTATGTFTYTHTYAALTNPGRQIPGVSWASGATTLTGATGTFLASDVGTATNPTFVAGPSAGGINANSVITAVAADGSSATISIPTTAANPTATGDTIGTGKNLTFVDAAFNTGPAAFTTNVAAGSNANIGIIEVDTTSLIAFPGGLVLPFGGVPGVGFIPTPPATTPPAVTACLLTGTGGPAQFGQTAPLLPAGTTTALVATTGGFICQPAAAGSTAPACITPPPAAHVTTVGPTTTTTVAPTTTTTVAPTTTTTVAPTTTTTVPFPTSKDQCKNGGWRQFGFKNQGQCISNVQSTGTASQSGTSLNARLVRYVRPNSEGGVAMLALAVGFGLFVLGLVLPPRRRRA